MIIVNAATLAHMEEAYPGFLKHLAHSEALNLPPCTHCGSPDTAAVQTGVIGRTINLTAATSKFHLTPNGSTEGSLWCNPCRRYFGPSGACDLSLY